MVLTKWLNSKLETKYVYSTPVQCTVLQPSLLNDTLFNQSITSTIDCYGLMPVCPQGVGVNQRIGEQIQPLSLKLQLALSLVTPTNLVTPLGTSGNSGPEDITVHVYILRSKDFPSWQQQYSLNVGTDLLSPYQGQNELPFDGTYWNSKLPVNTVKYNVLHHKQIRLRKSAGYQSYVKYADQNSSNDPAGALNCVSQTGNQTAYLSLNIPIPKMLQYSNSAFNMPEDYFPFMCIGWVSNEYPLSAQWTRQLYPLAVTARTYLKFKDA